MDLRRASIRLLAVVIVAALPPLVAYAILNHVGDPLGGDGTRLMIASLIGLGWAILISVTLGRYVTDEARSLVELAHSGPERGSRTELTDAQKRMAEALEERNRQIADLALQVRMLPIGTDAAAVARAIVAAARSVTKDPTWTLAVLRTSDPASLPVGVYSPDESPREQAGEVHAWASSLESENDGVGARHAVGPWGAFVIVDVGAGDDRSILIAPREGRPPPSPAELDLLVLFGQQAGTAIEHALLYARLREQTDELQRMAAIQSDFLRSVTHDLQTPLTSIRAVAAELQARDDIDEPERGDLATIAQQADRLRRMVGLLLSASRLEAGGLAPRQEVFRIGPLVERTWEALRAGRPFSLEDRASAHLVVGDPDRLEQVLWAVLDNAVKYSPPGSAIAVTVSTEEADGELLSQLAVRDEGTGMDAETLRQAFTQFYRSADARRLSPDGSGVGLYAARGLVEAMNGSIGASSQLGRGTVITITLPAEAAEPADQEEPSAV